MMNCPGRALRAISGANTVMRTTSAFSGTAFTIWYTFGPLAAGRVASRRTRTALNPVSGNTPDK